MTRSAILAATIALCCAPALREPPPVSALASGRAGGVGVDELLRSADVAWTQRVDPGRVDAAQALYLDAAAADESRVEGLLGAMRAMAFRVERERDGSVRGRLAEQEVQLGQWCQRRAPANATCAYRLAIALGQQARERPSTAKDALGKMVELLRAAAAADPRLDSAGPFRVLALVQLRAPAWPLGPETLPTSRVIRGCPSHKRLPPSGNALQVAWDGYRRLPSILDGALRSGAMEELKDVLQALVEVVEWSEDPDDRREEPPPSSYTSCPPACSRRERTTMKANSPANR